MIRKKENQAVFLVMVGNILWSFYPILANHFGQKIPSIFFAACTMLVASFFCFIYLMLRGGFEHVFGKNIRFDLWMVTLLIIVIPSILFFIGAKGSSGVNATFLLLFELIFYTDFTHFIGERNTYVKLLGAGGILLGAGLILYNGTLAVNRFDLLIILSTLTYPFGNFFGKRLLFKLTPENILFFRTFFGGMVLLIISFLLERSLNIPYLFQSFWWLFLVNGVFVAFLSKIFWYHALKSLDISKAISLAMTFPIFSLFFLMVFFKETLSIYQFMCIVVMMIGVYFTVKRKSVDPKVTRYNPF